MTQIGGSAGQVQRGAGIRDHIRPAWTVCYAWPGRRRLAVAAMLGAATFGVLEAIQSVARADHSFSEPMSVYATGPYGFVQTVAFLVLAVGSAAVCAAISLPHPRPPDWQVARGLIVVWSVGVSVAAAFRINGSGSTAAQVHAAASMLSFLTVLAAMFFFARATRQVPAWYSFGKVSSVLASVAALAFVVAGATQPSIAAWPNGFSSAQSLRGSWPLVLEATFSPETGTSRSFVVRWTHTTRAS